ncbi:helix-turn-helix domain-containing protein (plasmid) [Embleya sp. NBC_00888]|uniref:helix-turn-helix domain-containing protein n=1 Tax=Embleya sp. NBC_00888 TaxID=2975960 RepID=UPI002F912D54|nr:helix-turn-helix domain-containing protein [Embleya sp. NBC_00888]
MVTPSRSTGEVPASAHRRELGSRLARLRKRADLTQAEAAGRVGIDRASFSRIERGLRGTGPDLVDALLGVYGADADERDAVYQLVAADRGRTRPWWRKHGPLVNATSYAALLTLETGARRLRGYEQAVLPGLVQTRAYAEHVIRALRPELEARQIHSLVNVRELRRRHLREAAVTVDVVVEEGALTRPVAPPDVLREQLRFLAETTDVTVRMLPTDVGCHAGLYGSFLLVDFPAPGPSVVWQENLAGSTRIETPEHVHRYDRAFRELWDHALTASQTRDRIRPLIEETTR